MGFLSSISPSRRATAKRLCNTFATLHTFKDKGNAPRLYFFIMSDMPGLNPSSFSTGRAFTSKVLRS